MGHIRRFLNTGPVFAYSLGDLQDVRDRYTIAGAPTIVGSPYGNVMRFDGAADYVTLTAEEEWNLRFDSGAQDFSVVAWTRTPTKANFQAIADKRDAVNDGWGLWIDTSGYAFFALNALVITGAVDLSDNIWHCVVIVIDRSGNGQMYVDGIASGAAIAIGGAVMATTTALRIGANSFNASAKFNGDIYAILVYDRILSIAEVLDLATHKAF